MFKKSEEQEWTRFRGALSKDRDDSVSAPAVTIDANDPGATGQPTPPAANATQTAPAGSSFRPIQDVNVGLPSARLTRSAGADGSDVETLIGERTHFEGTLRAEGAVRLLGTVDGEIQSAGTIIVEEKSHVTARLTASQVTIAGEVDGQIYCDGRVEIRPTGRVTGEISAGALIVQEGAYFDGNSRMAPPTAAGGASGAAGSGAAGSGAAGSHGSGSAGSGAGASAAGHSGSGSSSGSGSAGAGGSARGGSGSSSSDGAIRSSA